VLLIMGIGAQMVWWDEAFCRALAARGFEVTRFDNRDVGHSTRLEHLGVQGLNDVLKQRLLGRLRPAYTLDDMAEDTAQLMQALGHSSMHVIGTSLGGMVAQCLALNHPERVRSMTLVMTSPGELWAGVPTYGAFRALTSKRQRTREAVIARQIEVMRTLGGTRHNSPASLVGKMAALQFDRGIYPKGFMRQYAAAVAAPSRVRSLRSVRIPTLVVHGTVDPLLRSIGGRVLAAAIPGARLCLVEGMGHDLGPSIWPFFLDRFEDNARRERASLPSASSLETLWASPVAVPG
jgi:pimeloyl-ACP methyl ester carboxylesterase